MLKPSKNNLMERTYFTIINDASVNFFHIRHFLAVAACVYCCWTEDLPGVTSDLADRATFKQCTTHPSSVTEGNSVSYYITKGSSVLTINFSLLGFYTGENSFKLYTYNVTLCYYTKDNTTLREFYIMCSLQHTERKYFTFWMLFLHAALGS